MTVQAQEILKYRDENYSLIGAPLQPFLEKNKHIVFEDFSTAHWSGYQGYWLLESDKLYLTNIESSNYTMADIFKSEEPVLADWFDGQIEFGIGNYHSDHWWGYYDNYVWLNFKNGKVLEKKIIRRFYQDPEITFGKYKGKKFEEVIHGRIRYNTNTTLKVFIDCLLRYITDKEYGFKVQTPYFEVSKEDRELVQATRNAGLEYFLAPTYLAISSKIFWENSYEDQRAADLSRLLEKILTSDFTRPFTLSNQILQSAEIAEETMLINGDLQYLNWALKTVDHFTIPPGQLEKSISIKGLKMLKVKRLNDFIFEYEPVIETLEYKFSPEIFKTNQEKFEKSKKVKYVSPAGYYLPDMTEEELMDEFGHYLDENHIVQQRDDISPPDYDHGQYYYNPDDWLRDAAGTDDPETMNDVYWNLD